MNGRALVLLSGGLDSVAALHWSMDEFHEVCALAFDYGQPHRIELAVSQMVAERRGIPWRSLVTADGVRGGQPLVPPERGEHRRGLSRANIPARNAIFIMMAAAYGARLWSGSEFSIIIGANINDSVSFPDCRSAFFTACEETLRFALKDVCIVHIRAPWVEKLFTKSYVIGWAAQREDALDDIRITMSCYHGTRCGDCDACALRATAFRDANVEDGCYVPKTRGGDPHRER